MRLTLKNWRTSPAPCSGPYEQAGAKPGHIAIDVTGGQKTASVAAAMFTLDKRDLVFQYVSTTPPYETKTFYAETATLQFG
jgi:hypothetical protein